MDPIWTTHAEALIGAVGADFIMSNPTPEALIDVAGKESSIAAQDQKTQSAIRQVAKDTLIRRIKAEKPQWEKFAADCNKDSGYAHGQAAGLERSELEVAWQRECGNLQVPQVLWSNGAGKYVVQGFDWK